MKPLQLLFAITEHWASLLGPALLLAQGTGTSLPLETLFVMWYLGMTQSMWESRPLVFTELQGSLGEKVIWLFFRICGEKKALLFSGKHKGNVLSTEGRDWLLGSQTRKIRCP